MFNKFLNSLKRPGNESLIEAIQYGYQICFENLTVREEIPNRDSIAASLTNYEILPNIIHIPISKFDAKPTDMFYAKNDLDKVRKLATDISNSNEINPLIVVMDKEGYYVLEGGHRLAALYLLKEQTVPALVVKDLDSL